MKNGKPNKVVILPTGKDTPLLAIREIISAKSSKTLPNKRDEGNKYL